MRAVIKVNFELRIDGIRQDRRNSNASQLPIIEDQMVKSKHSETEISIVK